MYESMYITLGQIFNIVQAIPESQSGDTVTIEIRRLSDNYTWHFTNLVFQSGNNTGNMTFVNGILWKASFTPQTKDTYIVTIHDSTLDVKYVQQLIALNQATPITSVEEITETDAATLLAAVEQAIAARVNGGAVQSYSIGGRNLQYVSLTELREMRKELRREVNLNKPSKTYAKFVQPA
jgi:hypothetical protein